MLSRILTRLVILFLLATLALVSAFAQTYPGGGTPTGTYTPPKGGYSSGAAIGIGVGVAAGVGIAYLALRDRATLVGCVEESTGGMKLMNEKDKRTYTLAAGSSDIKPGERVALKGKKAKGKSGEPTFDVTKVAKDYGSCSKKTAENTAP